MSQLNRYLLDHGKRDPLWKGLLVYLLATALTVVLSISIASLLMSYALTFLVIVVIIYSCIGYVLGLRQFSYSTIFVMSIGIFGGIVVNVLFGQNSAGQGAIWIVLPILLLPLMLLCALPGLLLRLIKERRIKKV